MTDLSKERSKVLKSLADYERRNGTLEMQLHNEQKQFEDALETSPVKVDAKTKKQQKAKLSTIQKVLYNDAVVKDQVEGTSKAQDLADPNVQDFDVGTLNLDDTTPTAALRFPSGVDGFMKSIGYSSVEIKNILKAIRAMENGTEHATSLKKYINNVRQKLATKEDTIVNQFPESSSDKPRVLRLIKQFDDLLEVLLHHDVDTPKLGGIDEDDDPTTPLRGKQSSKPSTPEADHDDDDLSPETQRLVKQGKQRASKIATKNLRKSLIGDDTGVDIGQREREIMQGDAAVKAPPPPPPMPKTPASQSTRSKKSLTQQSIQDVRLKTPKPRAEKPKEPNIMDEMKARLDKRRDKIDPLKEAAAAAKAAAKKPSPADDDWDDDPDDKLVKRGKGYLVYDKDDKFLQFGKLLFNRNMWKRLRVSGYRNNRKVVEGDLTEGLRLLLTQKGIGKNHEAMISPEDVESYKRLCELAEIDIDSVPMSNKRGKILRGYDTVSSKASQGSGKTKTKIVYYQDPQELMKRLELLTGSFDSGNHSPELIEEATSILDILKSKGLISQIDYVSMTEYFL